MKEYNTVIIGSGPAAHQFAKESFAANQSNEHTLVIESKSFGGICPNVGCEPKIFYDGTAKSVLATKNLLDDGIQNVATMNWTRLVARKQSYFSKRPAQAEAEFHTLGVDTIQGTAHFESTHVIVVNDEKIHAERIVIATGQKPRRLPIVGEENTLTSDDILDLAVLPKSMIFIGSGFVSMELATIMNAAGVEVTILEASPRALATFPKQLVQTVVSAMESRGIKLLTNAAVNEVAKQSDSEFNVTVSDGRVFEAGMVVDASGRVPNTLNLGLDAIGVSTDKGGIVVDNHLQTNVEGIYAAGDVISKRIPKLTPTAQFEGAYLQHLFSGNDKPISYPNIASAAFTFPQVAQIGISIDDASSSDEYKIETHALGQNNDAFAGMNDGDATLQFVFDKDDTLVGVAEVGQNASEDIANFLPYFGKNAMPVFPSTSFRMRKIYKSHLS